MTSLAIFHKIPTLPPPLSVLSQIAFHSGIREYYYFRKHEYVNFAAMSFVEKKKIDMSFLCLPRRKHVAIYTILHVTFNEDMLSSILTIVFGLIRCQRYIPPRYLLQKSKRHLL